MSTAMELWRQRKVNEIWQKYCGFIELGVDEFMEIQNHLLLEQLTLLKDCELGRNLLWGTKPSSVEEFRQKTPLTTYRDYAPFLLERREDALPEKPLFWQRTSGRSGEYSCKWVPIPERLYREVGLYCVAAVIFSSSKKRGEFALRDHDKFLYALAPPPYATGSFGQLVEDVFDFDVMPPKHEAEAMGFAERTRDGFSLALTKGLDVVFALSSVLVALGEQFSRGSNVQPSAILSRPRALPRLAK